MLSFFQKRKTNKSSKPKNKTFKQFKRAVCSPAVKNKTVSSESCFTPETLLKVKNAYNAEHPDSQITSRNVIEIWNELRQKLQCEKEQCWLNQLKDKEVKSQLKSLLFAPDQPDEWKSDPDAWLSNFDIFDVLKQYSEKYPEFEILGPTTIDFDSKPAEYMGKCVNQKICDFDLDTMMKKGKRKFGFVFNLDTYKGYGTHWVSMFLDLDAKIIMYFDSAGAPTIPKQIYRSGSGTNSKTEEKEGEPKPIINRIIEQYNAISNGGNGDSGGDSGGSSELKLYHNAGKAHQKTNTECGMYSLFFIITMLTGEIPHKNKKLSVDQRIRLFTKSRIPDKTVFDYRELFFNK